jgi:hypothetical protein
MFDIDHGADSFMSRHKQQPRCGDIAVHDMEMRSTNPRRLRF